MEGQAIQPVDEDQVRQVVREAQVAGCEAFAVSGFAGVINPAHEILTGRIAFMETGLHAVCGHELTSNLNFVERATTAAMNAKLVPLIERLLDAVSQALEDFGLSGVRIMVVKGDGSQMLDRVAREFPVETLLSGPAASVVGAAKLFSHPDAVVVDMGGTTLDTAVFRDRMPVRSERGARIGDFQTSVRAMAVHTIGLGGDSEIDLCNWPDVRIGPRRIIPVCRMTQMHPETQGTLDTLSERFIAREPNCLDFAALPPGVTPANELLQQLGTTPIMLVDLAKRLNRPGPRFINWEDEESRGRLQRYGFTITDILHVQEHYNAFDRRASLQVLECWAAILNTDPETLIEAVHHEFRRMTCEEILGAALPTSCPWPESAEFRRWLTGQLAGSRVHANSLASFRVRMDCPVIGVGAPTPALFPQLAEMLEQQVLISEYAAVANAVGAVAGDVLLQQSASIRITEEGVFVCSWRGGSMRTGNLETAIERCGDALLEILQSDADANCIPYSPPVFSAYEQKGETRDGTVLLGITLSAELRG